MSELSLMTEDGCLGDYEGLALNYDFINRLLKKDGCDLMPLLYSPEDAIDEEELAEMKDIEGEELEQAMEEIRVVTTEELFPIKDVLAKITKAYELASEYPEDEFLDDGKEMFLEDLEEIRDTLEAKKEEDLKLYFMRLP